MAVDPRPACLFDIFNSMYTFKSAEFIFQKWMKSYYIVLIGHIALNKEHISTHRTITSVIQGPIN